MPQIPMLLIITMYDLMLPILRKSLFWAVKVIRQPIRAILFYANAPVVASARCKCIRKTLYRRRQDTTISSPYREERTSWLHPHQLASGATVR
jgi:hypothetical protein